MNAWFALTKKEFRLGLPAFLIALILYAGIIAGGFIIGNQFGYKDEFIMTSLAIVVTLHVFFLLFYLFHSLNSERKRLHLWLHTPMPIGGLLSSKLITGIVFMTLTFIVSIILSGTFFNNHYDFFNEQTLFNIIGLSTLSIFLLGISLAILFIFFWSIFLTLSQRMNDFLSFVLTFILFLFAAWAYDLFIHLSFIETITTWGPIQVKDVIVGFEFSIFEDGFDAGTMSEASIFYVGQILSEIIVAIIMFIGACWIIDKKVEV